MISEQIQDEAEVQRMLEEDEMFVSVITELRSLRAVVLEQKNFSASLENQLKSANKAQIMNQELLNRMELKLQQQLENASAKSDWTAPGGSFPVDEHVREQTNKSHETTDNALMEDVLIILSDDEHEHQLNVLAHSPREHQKQPSNRKSVITQSYDEIDLDAEQSQQFEKVPSNSRPVNPSQDKFDKIDDTPHYPHNNCKQNDLQSSPIISTSRNIATTQSSSSLAPCERLQPWSTPPHLSSAPFNYTQPHSNLFSQSTVPLNQGERFYPWSMSPRLWSGLYPPPPYHTVQNAAVAKLSSVYESSSDMNPLKMKKLQSISSTLALAQPNVSDSSQPTPFFDPTHSNRTGHSGMQHTYDGHPHSPYTDKSFEEDNMQNRNESRIIPQRYKQYTRGDIQTALECIRNGMSTLQASREYNVPPRTLYDQNKKLRTTSGRQMNQTMQGSSSNSGSPSSPFPYRLSGSGTSSPYSVNDNHHGYDLNQWQWSHHNDSGDRDTGPREHDQKRDNNR